MKLEMFNFQCTPTILLDKSIIVKVCHKAYCCKFVCNLVRLYDELAELNDNVTLEFETLDTCFCYGYCGCSVRDHMKCIVVAHVPITVWT